MVSWCICFSFQALPYWGDTLLCRKISDYYSMKPLGPAAPKLLVTPRTLQFISDFCTVIELHWSPWKIKKDYVLCNILCKEYLSFGLFPEWIPVSWCFSFCFQSIEHFVHITLNISTCSNYDLQFHSSLLVWLKSKTMFDSHFWGHGKHGTLSKWWWMTKWKTNLLRYRIIVFDTYQTGKWTQKETNNVLFSGLQ